MRRRITIDLEEDLLGEVDRLARETDRSRNEVVAESLARVIREYERGRIDRAFEAMAEDPDYQEELLRIEREMCSGSDEAWSQIDRVAERRRGGESRTSEG